MEQESKNWYDKSYKLVLIFPAILLLISIIYLYNFQNREGDVIYKDVSLTGGTSITVFDENVKIDEVKSSLANEFPDIVIRGISDFRTGGQKGFIVETKAEADNIKSSLENYLGYELNQENSSVEFSGATLSQGFYQQLRLAIIAAFVLMSIVVFIIFRTFIPSAVVILCAFADIIMTVAVVDFLGINLSTAGVVAFLMLIGYSVDTDILLTIRVLKKGEGTINERIYGAFKTGIMMTLTAIGAIAVSLFIIYGSSDVLQQMFTILLIGLVFDIFNTWVTNASLIKLYAGKKEHR